MVSLTMLSVAQAIYRVYQEVPAKLLGNVPWINLSQNNQTYPCLKFDTYGNKDKRSFKQSALPHTKGKYCQI
jgi:hypothetical protein